VVATFAGRPLEIYVGAAGAFARGYRSAYLIDPDPYAIFGYDAARLVLDALGRSKQSFTLDRGTIREAALATKDLDAALGKWSMTPQGETTYDALQLYVVRALPNAKTAWTWDSEIRP
jgi:branched-chain amino acid transport system substrate-binding protein